MASTFTAPALLHEKGNSDVPMIQSSFALFDTATDRLLSEVF
jgi:hypothetical protein